MIRNRYHEWLCGIVGGSTGYSYLLKDLDNIFFEFSIPMDSNRYEDGVELRYKFGRQMSIPDTRIARELDIYPCTMLEMMIALSLRIEDEIMTDSYEEEDSKTYIWFWSMVDSLGLSDMTDDISYDDSYVLSCVERFLSRTYCRNGRGGLFTISDPTKDLRQVEIWYQAMWFLNDYISKEKETE